MAGLSDDVIAALGARAFPILPRPPFSALPPLLAPSKQVHAGPIAESNWAIPDVLIAGAYPGSLSLEEAKKKTRALVECGVSLFLNLLDRGERNRFNPYDEHIRNHSSDLQKPLPVYVWLPIQDQHVADDQNLLPVLLKLLQCLRQPQPPLIYVHCWGGHGRTGTIISLLLGALYDLEADLALALCNAYHSQRVVRKSRSPQAAAQFDQVKRLINSKWWEAAEAAPTPFRLIPTLSDVNAEQKAADEKKL